MNIFTIGSCFAVNIRKHLRDMGYTVYPEDAKRNLNYYNTYSILYEFERPDREQDFYQNSNLMWQDPFRRLVLKDTKQNLIDYTRITDTLVDSYIDSCDMFIITLGMSEVWKSQSGLVYNQHPQYGVGPSRSGALKTATFYNATVEDNVLNLAKIRDSIRKRVPEARIIFTVSPVPLERTFSQFDLKRANWNSKGKLKTAIKQISDVEYFDSFEYCMERNRKENIYKEDGRHVKDNVVKDVVKRFKLNIMKTEKIGNTFSYVPELVRKSRAIFIEIENGTTKNLETLIKSHKGKGELYVKDPEVNKILEADLPKGVKLFNKGLGWENKGEDITPDNIITKKIDLLILHDKVAAFIDHCFHSEVMRDRVPQFTTVNFTHHKKEKYLRLIGRYYEIVKSHNNYLFIRK